MRETDDGMARALLPAVVATACALAASAVVYATVALTHAKPHVGDIVAFASAEGDAADPWPRGGTLLGAYLIALLNNFLNFLHVSSEVQLVVQGLIIMLAVSVYRERRRLA